MDGLELQQIRCYLKKSFMRTYGHTNNVHKFYGLFVGFMITVLVHNDKVMRMH